LSHQIATVGMTGRVHSTSSGDRGEADGATRILQRCGAVRIHVDAGTGGQLRGHSRVCDERGLHLTSHDVPLSTNYLQAYHQPISATERSIVWPRTRPSPCAASAC
jgi:hypothetical protein